jgi:hypothetical protein
MTNYLPDLLDAVEIMLRRFVVFRTEAQSIATTLWIAHTHAIEIADQTPYLAVTSAEKQSGKTRLIEVAELLVRNPCQTAHISAAALYRTIAEERPTLLFDEIDTVFGKRVSPETESLRKILNAGHRRGAAVRLCVGEGRNQKVGKFDVFCAKLLSGIGTLPDTVSDRSIHIRLQRRRRTEHVERFRVRHVEPDAAHLRQALEESLAHASDKLRTARPVLPVELDDRSQDGWEPLLAIADLAGGDWPGAGRAAAVDLAHTAVHDDESLGVLALGHIREAFDGAERLSTEDLLRSLTERDDGPWADWWGRDIEDDRIKGPASKLSRILKPFEVAPEKYRDGVITKRGYLRENLEPVWERYLPPSPPPFKDGTRNTAGSHYQEGSVFRLETGVRGEAEG